eukprot:m.909625 g.909625  ORF g.909625 m.909625 type:complete len:261 (-) comp23721_c0_seq5:2517-3299(-)
MPTIKVLHVASFSSEIPTAPAENVLNSSTTRVWKANAGKPAAIELQLEKASEIDTVNLGNAGSHLVEVFAGSSTSTEPFVRLIPTTTLMTKDEAKASIDFSDDLTMTSSKINQCVKLFDHTHMIDSVARAKYDRVRIVCTCPPWNTTDPFGLTFVEFSSPPVPPPKPSLGIFSFKASSDTPAQASRADALKRSLSDKFPSTLRAAKEAAEQRDKFVRNPPISAVLCCPLLSSAVLSSAVLLWECSFRDRSPAVDRQMSHH